MSSNIQRGHLGNLLVDTEHVAATGTIHTSDEGLLVWAYLPHNIV